MYKYIGIDISKATLDVYDGKKSYKFDNSINGFKKITKLSSKDKELCLIFEPTGIYSYALVEFCQKNSIKAIIVGSKEARDYARSIKQRSKTDKIDAKVLYRYHTQILDINTIRIPSIDYRVKKITQRYNLAKQYEKSIASLKNILEASSKEDKYLIRTIKKEIKHLLQVLVKLEKEIEELILKDKSQKEAFSNLLTIPGIGKKSALIILLEFMHYPNANSKEMVALMGLDPVLKTSGNHKGKTKISKQGGSELRKTLYMPMLVAIRYNDRLKLFYERLVSNGKTKKMAIIAAMRKLIRIAFCIVKNNVPYKALD